jgi:hypothetical protein
VLPLPLRSRAVPGNGGAYSPLGIGGYSGLSVPDTGQAARVEIAVTAIGANGTVR